MQPVIESALDAIGQVSLNIYNSLNFIRTRHVKMAHVLQQAALIGFDSLPIVVIINLIAGCVLALHASEMFAMTGANEYIGAMVALAIVREMGPIFTALAVGARAGTAISAEIANMAVTKQLDALNIMHVSPIRYLMAPRLLACLVGLPLVTIIAECIGILAGMVTARATVGVHYAMFMGSVWLHLKPYDIEVSLVKAAVFGILLAGIAVTIGLNTKGGARNVGLATTQATVWTAICVIIADFFLTWMFFGTSFRQE